MSLPILSTVILVVALVLLIILEALLAWRGARRPPPGVLVDTGGRTMHYVMMGDEHTGPTAVLESGGGGFSLEWAAVQPEIARFMRVVSYDRAGYGWSSVDTAPRTPQRVADDLYALLKHAGVPTPFIVIGHSIGGIYAIAFARRYPQDVAGIVLVDSAHPDQWEQPEFPKWSQTLSTGALIMLARLGLLRAQANWQISRYLPPYARADYTAMIRRGVIHSLADEVRQFESESEQIARMLGDLPVAVLSRTPKNTRARRAWQLLQADLATISARSWHVQASNSDHYIHLQEPWLVVDMVRQLRNHVMTAGYSHVQAQGVAGDDKAWSKPCC